MFSSCRHIVHYRIEFLKSEGVIMDNIQETEESEDEVTQVEDTKVTETCMVLSSVNTKPFILIHVITLRNRQFIHSRDIGFIISDHTAE